MKNKTDEDVWPKRAHRIEQQPKPPEGSTVTTVYVPEPKFKRRRQFRAEARLCEHIDTKDYYKRKLVKKITRGAKLALTDAQVAEARLLVKELSFPELATKYAVSLTTIKNAVKGITFKHLNLKCRPQG
jgi:hypothetical protein